LTKSCMGRRESLIHIHLCIMWPITTTSVISILLLHEYCLFQNPEQGSIIFLIFRTQKLLKQGYVAPMLTSSLQKVYIRHHNLVWLTEIATIDLLLFASMFSYLYHCQDFYQTWLYLWVTRRVSYKKQELLTLRKHMRSPSIFWWGLSCSSV
jgi:hypothetical protein